ncbi:C1 family peptidase [Mesorhizobium sp. IMUNJ 23232]|uniref:C1 family peptidase n=1 Tax=Mesorhizobium sp. IMUNJ 23232 TaxID=3376064 RepID=UPI00379B94C3
MAKSKTDRVFDALPDTVDFRDQMYIPTLIEVPSETDVENYRAREIPVLDQGREGACTGYGLATVVNYLLRTGRTGLADDAVSAQMLYAMAKRYDEWPGEDYEGSSARGAMKGWHKHGVCGEKLWTRGRQTQDIELDDFRQADALQRPLGAYFRVNHRDLVGMHSAITEAGILFGTCLVHEGWMNVKSGDTEIAYSTKMLGGHAFAIVAYDQYGFWIQNSWGPKWGSGGLARLSYSDWLENGTDVWVARLGVPVFLARPEATARMRSAAPRSNESFVSSELQPHVVTMGNDGRLRETGTYGLTPAALGKLVREQVRRTVAQWSAKRVLLYAHGGLVSEDSALQFVANNRQFCLSAEVYPIAFIWRSDAWTTLKNVLQEVLRRRKPEGILDAAKDFMLDRLDDTIEPVARLLGGKTLWDEMKENATLAAASAKGGARMTADHLVEAVKAGEVEEVHLAGHSAGSILMAPLAQHLVSKGVRIASLSLWAPACTVDLFEKSFLPLLKQEKGIDAFDLYTLDDATENNDDCANIYHKSLLYLVSGAFEAEPRIPLFRPRGTPLLGLARDVEERLKPVFTGKTRRWILSPGEFSRAVHHGDFDNDEATLRTTLKRITGSGLPKAQPATNLAASPAARARFRENLDKTLAARP